MLYSIHFLRFVASMAVVMHHASSYYHSRIMLGGAGVDVFFVISGLVIGLSTTSSETAKNFVLKRFIRVVPMYWLATTFYVYWRYYTWSLVPTFDQAWRSYLLIPHSGVDWAPIYWPAWSIGYEVFFYAIMTLAIIVSAKRATTICVIAILLTASTSIPVPWKSGFIFQSQWGLEFAGGMTFSAVVASGFQIDRIKAAIFLVASATLFAASAIPTGVPRVIEWGVPSGLLVIGATGFESLPWLRYPFVRWIGNASYSIYLIHLSVIEAIRELGDRHGLTTKDHPVFFFVVPVIIAALLGILVNRWVETPLLNMLRRLLLPVRRTRTAAQAIPEEAQIVSSYSA